MPDASLTERHPKMPGRRYIFADEAGDFQFARSPNVSKYFIVCTVAVDDCAIGHQLLDLRRQLLCDGYPFGDYFYASEDKQAIRDRVYECIRGSKLAVHATILEKSKAQPQTHISKARFYKYAWYFHFSGISRRLTEDVEHLLITTASAGVRKAQAAFTAAVKDVLLQRLGAVEWTTHFCQSMADPCLQVAHYCAWAIQRKWERGVRSWKADTQAAIPTSCKRSTGMEGRGDRQARQCRTNPVAVVLILDAIDSNKWLPCERPFVRHRAQLLRPSLAASWLT